jgi:hypothetical protein
MSDLDDLEIDLASTKEGSAKKARAARKRSLKMLAGFHLRPKWKSQLTSSWATRRPITLAGQEKK